jgi:hypothetical protein
MKADLTYSTYLHLEDLLNAQHPRSADGQVEHDEMLFIIIHQVYELVVQADSPRIGLHDGVAPSTRCHSRGSHSASRLDHP